MIFLPIWTAAAIGAALGDGVSYWLGVKVGERVFEMWPLSNHPGLLMRGRTFVQRWGAVAVFIGRFFGPLRASVPAAAGILGMPYWHFQMATFVSAFIWAGVLLGIGDFLDLMFEVGIGITGGA